MKKLLPILLLAVLLPAVGARASIPRDTAPTLKPAETHWEGTLAPGLAPLNVAKGGSIQVLEPIGARVVKPKDWFFARTYDRHGYTWVISRENPREAGGYKTGLRLQLLQGIRHGTQKSPQRFIEDFFTKKKGEGKPDSEVCSAKTFASFQRRCLATEEEIEGQGKTKFHVVYSGLWNNETDTVLLMTFSAPAAEWQQAAPIANDMMEGIDLPDLSKKITAAQAHRYPACLDRMTAQDESKLFAAVTAGGRSRRGVVAVGALGNALFALDATDPHPLNAAAFAAKIKASRGYNAKQKVLLLWPYSAAGAAPFLHELHSLLGNEVLGAEGPLWWYPDGTAVVTDPKRGLQWPTAKNISACFMRDGKFDKGDACRKKVAKLDHAKAVFGNTLFAPRSCADLGRMGIEAVLGDRDQSFALYMFYTFVANDDDKASTFLSLAAFGHHALAEYFAAQEVRLSNRDLSLQLLRHAAADGDAAAVQELKDAK